jgi:hypothetical protein
MGANGYYPQFYRWETTPKWMSNFLVHTSFLAHWVFSGAAGCGAGLLCGQERMHAVHRVLYMHLVSSASQVFIAMGIISSVARIRKLRPKEIHPVRGKTAALIRVSWLSCLGSLGADASMSYSCFCFLLCSGLRWSWLEGALCTTLSYTGMSY